MCLLCIVSPGFCSALTGLQCVAYLQLRLLHVVDQTGVDTAAVSGNLYLQLVVENYVSSSPVLGAPLQNQQCPSPFSTIHSLCFSRLVLQLSNCCFVVKVAVLD